MIRYGRSEIRKITEDKAYSCEEPYIGKYISQVFEYNSEDMENWGKAIEILVGDTWKEVDDQYELKYGSKRTTDLEEKFNETMDGLKDTLKELVNVLKGDE